MENHLSFIQTNNIHEFGPILESLAEDFTPIFYHTILNWCNIIPRKEYSFWEVWLIKLEDKPIGICGLYTLQGAKDASELWLGWLGIIPELRNLGLGKQVMQHLYVEANKVGSKKMFSYVDKGGAPLSFYKREGFDIIGTVGNYLINNNIPVLDGEDFESPDDYVICKILT